ncbi:MAG: TolC family protein [Proteobacteria bacterium]|nr:TolC family protein [Desulfobulbaceae bacterium]MBU4152985.1 TolC family protein [Pseudomonadota bacterium]
MKRFVCWLAFGPLGVSLVLPILLATAEPIPPALTELVAESLVNNPELHAAKKRWQMSERQIIPARSLEDPRLSLTFSNYPIDSLAFDETPMTGNELNLAQTFPFPGKLAAKGEMAEQQALWFRGVYEDGKLQLVKKVKDSYYRLFFQDQGIRIINQNIAILDDVIHLTETKYQVGKGLQQDVLKAQVERSKLMDKLFSLKQMRVSILADLNTLRNQPTAKQVTPPAIEEMTPVEVELNELQQGSEKHRPLYASYRSLIERYKAQKYFAQLEYYPNITVSAGYRFRATVPGDPVQGADFVSAGVGINLPFNRKKRHEAVAEADSGIDMASDQYNDFRNKVLFNLHDTYAQMEKNRNQVSLYKTGILPQADQTFQASLAAYQVNKVDFLNLLDSLLSLYRYQIDYYQVLADYQRNVAGLEAESGMDLSRTPAAETGMESQPNNTFTSSHEERRQQ